MFAVVLLLWAELCRMYKVDVFICWG